jgi:hypothetical protein
MKDIKQLTKDIVFKADEIKRTLVSEKAPVNYACIFCQTGDEYIKFLGLARQIGNVVQETKMGPVFKIEPLNTVAGPLKLIKIRKPDPNKTEQGDADFTLSNYQEFKKEHLNKLGFKLIDKGDFEMIEYKAPGAEVLVYFSYPTLAEVLKINLTS